MLKWIKKLFNRKNKSFFRKAKLRIETVPFLLCKVCQRKAKEDSSYCEIHQHLDYYRPKQPRNS